MAHPPPPTSGGDIFCIACGYSLRGLPSNRCPECGREFDPDDPRTMSHARPLRAWQQWVLKPVGWPTITLALAGSALLVYLGWRPNWRPEPPTVLVHEFSWRASRLRPITVPDVVFFSAVALWLAFLLSLGFRQLARLLVPRVARRANRPPQPRLRRRAIVLAIAVSVLFMLFGWEARIGRRWMAWAMIAPPPTINYRWNPWPGRALGSSPVQLTPQEAGEVLSDALVDLPGLKERQCAFRLLVESAGDAAATPLMRAVEKEPDPALLVWELRVIGLCRDAATLPMLVDRLQDTRPEVRAAAADAIGILHEPSYSIAAPNRFWVTNTLSLDTNPPIGLGAIVPPSNTMGRSDDLQDEPAIPLRRSVRAMLERMMLEGSTTGEREAAARSLVNWPPPKYHLRYAEWGVWIDNRGSLALAKSIIAEIPSFVHGTGDPTSSFSDYFLYPSAVSKPIIHLTSDVSLAADVEVQIREGRPWFAYPKPDDFGIGALPEEQGAQPLDILGYFGTRIAPHPDPMVSPSVPSLTQCREGYPWLIPHHRQYSSGPWGNAAIYRLGLRWQSLIVCPDHLSWMKLPTVSKDPKFGWWVTLRSVPSSWVTSRGETERFIYYDGPTRAETPISAHLDAAGTQLTFTAADIQPPYSGYNNSGTAYVFHPLAPTPKPGLAEHEGLYVQVHDGVLQGQYVLPDPAVVVGLDATLPLQGQAVVDRFRRMLLDYGLTAAEAEGLIRVWRPQFFRTEGRRFILRLSPQEYARQCPLQMRPAPTELVRLGLVLSEFDATPATEPSAGAR